MLNTPPAWRKVSPDRANIAARWVSPKSSENVVSGAIVIEVCTPLILDLKRIAVSLASRWHGELVDKPDTLGGDPAWRIVAAVSQDLQPVEGIICIHEGRLYLLEGDVTDGHACHDQIEAIRQGWSWIALDPSARIDPPAPTDPLAQLDAPVDSRSKGLEFRYQPITIFKGRISLNFPAMMQLKNDGYPEQRLMLSLQYHEHAQPDFVAILQSGQLIRGDTLSHFEEGLGKIERAKFDYLDPFVWHKIESDSARCEMTQLIAIAGWQKSWLILGVALLPDNQIVFIVFTTAARDADDRALYIQTAEKILESVTLSTEAKRDLERQNPPASRPPSNALRASRDGADLGINRSL